MSFSTNPHRRRLSATTTTTSVDCEKQVRSWRFLRTIVQLLLPSCYCTLVDSDDNQEDKSHRQTKPRTSSASSTNSTTFTGTIFGFRKGKVNFCIQATNSKTLNPIIVLLELTVPTEVLAREMRGGVLRIALESNENDGYNSHQDSSSSLLTTPLWNMYCNGRKVGFAIKREPSETELAALKVLTPVAEGAGVVNGEEINREKSDHMMYLRASFKRVFGSFDSESFHLIDPRGVIGQELSIFFVRSTRR